MKLLTTLHCDLKTWWYPKSLYIYTLGVKDIRHGWNLPISFTVFAFEVEPMFLNLSKPEGFWNTPTIFSCETTILHFLHFSAHFVDMVYEKCFISQCTMLIWYIKSIFFLPITHFVYEKSRMSFRNFGSKSNILTWKWTINGFNPFLLVRKCNIAYEKVRHHGMKIIIFSKTFEISVSCSILELPVVPIDDANSISFTVWQITWQITSYPVLHKIINQLIVFYLFF